MSCFAQALDAWGDSLLACDDEGRTLTYRQARSASEDWRTLTSRAEKQLFILYSENSVPCLSAYFGILGAGHALMLMSADAAPSTMAELEARFMPHWVVRPGIEGLSIEPSAKERPAALHPDLSLLLPTSGSTGAPKFARFTEAALFANASSISKYLMLGPSEHAMAHLPLHYSFGMSIVNSHAVVGARLSLTKRSIMEPSFWSRLAEQEATSFSGVPFHFEAFLRFRMESRVPQSVRSLTQAGGRLRPEHVRAMTKIANERGWSFYVMYGQTEAGPRLTYLPPAKAHSHAGSIGIPVPHVELSLVDEKGVVIEHAGVEGEVVASGPSIMMGYAAVAEDLERGDELCGRLLTGDIAKRDDDGFYWITGRKSRFIKLQGNRVSLDAIETKLGSLGADVVCVGEDDALYVVVQQAEHCESVAALVSQEFSFPIRHVNVLSVPELPRSSSNKLNFAALLQMARAAVLERQR